MKRLTVLLATILLAVIALAFQAVGGQSSTTGVTGAGSALLPSGTQLGGVNLKGMQFGIGALVSGNGFATGEVQVTLSGTTLTGQAQSITVEGQAFGGSRNSDGSIALSGLSTVTLGNGTALTGVPFTATVTAGTVTLKIGPQALPAAKVTAGSIRIE